MNSLIRIVGIIVLAVGCTPTPSSVENGPVDVNALIDDQVDLLSQWRAELSKKAHVDGILYDSKLFPTMEAWKAELDVFRQLGIVNKTMYQSTYRLEGPLDDPRSNLLIDQYTSPTSPLKSLKIYYLEDLSRIRKIEGLLMSGTILYTTERNLTLDFDEENGKTTLKRYTINGFQKLALLDTVRFHLVSTINL